jgi:hypothetical protein
MKAIVLFVSCVLAISADAACTLNLQKEDLGRGERWELSWDKVPGATGFILESPRTDPETGTVTTRRREVPIEAGTRVTTEVSVTTSENLTVPYRVIAIGVPDCSGTIEVTWVEDVEFQRMTRKSVIPLVGSARGANNSNFKTSLRLRGTHRNQRGILVFHPANVPPKSSDPTLVYNLPTTSDVIVYDDVVAAFGATGLGSIEIIPDFSTEHGWTVPYAEVRLYNVDANGTYGTLATQTQAIDFLSGNPEAITSLILTAPGPELRVNLGVRAFEDTIATMKVSRNGDVIASKDWPLDADFLFFNSALASTGITPLPGDLITIEIPAGGGVPMYSLTDNRTNDPALFVPPTRIKFDVGSADVGF